MTQYLIRHITDSTGHTFVEVIKPRENERYEIVSAESKKEAEERIESEEELELRMVTRWDTDSMHI